MTAVAVGVDVRAADEDQQRPSSPSATRQRHARWRDPRLWVGVVLVLASMVIGARLLSAAGDTVAVWRLTHDVAAGSPVAPEDVQPAQVHFQDAAVAGAYLSADRPLPTAAAASHDLQAGELLSVASLERGPEPAVAQLPLGVAAADQPPDLRPGDRVDVWAVPDATTSRAPEPPARVLRNVLVLQVGSSAVGVSGERQVLVAVDASIDVGAVLQDTSSAGIVLVRRAG